MSEINPKALRGVTMKMEFETGRCIKTIEDVLSLEKGASITLDNKAGVIPITLNRSPFGKGVILRKDGFMYVQITERNR
ncbi:FliM/FliN family flagellar motor switch protein (plasmid) [Pontibacillus sp. ALD_SL1]|uniref:FliM/FliN family flagellar motor switch protein n=1 Tax=Pontibacillus sp. ALD_SL1 TaxID=2777185 RepID=UPI001A96B555|nr:FliM/FliN family flagellar motor switch protein [Pontibacillus sp. ALD_SL1]QST03042.1 FliM/FliN family flagellar motor switch protein [Pontibacillus sp. ALD_SL1]